MGKNKPIINYVDFEKLEMRVGKVIGVEMPEWSSKLLKFEVDFGEESGVGKRIIFSGVKKWYGKEDFLNKKFIFLINMEAKKMGEEESQGMMLMADDTEKPMPIPVTDEVEVGVVVR